MARGEDTGNHPRRQVGRESLASWYAAGAPGNATNPVGKALTAMEDYDAGPEPVEWPQDWSSKRKYDDIAGAERTGKRYW